MAKAIKRETIHAGGIDIGIYTTDFKNEFNSLTDIAKYRSIDPRVTIHNWLRGRDVVEFLGLWEILHNPDFKRIDFDTFKENVGPNAFVFSIKDWTEKLECCVLLERVSNQKADPKMKLQCEHLIDFFSLTGIMKEINKYISDIERIRRTEDEKITGNY